MMNPSDQMELTRLVEAMQIDATRFNLDFQEARFAQDFVEFGRSGRVYSRQQVIRTESQPNQAKLPLQNHVFRELDSNTVQLIYNSEVVYAGVVEFARRSSIWSRNAPGLAMRFHQGTPYFPVSHAAAPR